jgi:hypothetical protein
MLEQRLASQQLLERLRRGEVVVLAVGLARTRRRVVCEIESSMPGSRASSAFTSVLFPAPEGAATM